MAPGNGCTHLGSQRDGRACMLCLAIESHPVEVHATGDGDVLKSLETDLYICVQHSLTDRGQHVTAGHRKPWMDLMQPQTVDAEGQHNFVRRCLRGGGN